MKRHFFLIIAVIIAFLSFLGSCNRSPVWEGEALPIDSLFLDLGKEQVALRKVKAERFFQEMHKTQGLNGVVL